LVGIIGINPEYILNEMSLDEISAIINAKNDYETGKLTFEKKAKNERLTKEQLMSRLNNGKARR
jgi:uncharacterized protein YeeX (DUF496 family)